jgi:hypothetical protein
MSQKYAKFATRAKTMSIFPRPLKKVLDKIIPFSQEDKVPTFNLGTGTADNTTFLRGDGTWATPSGGSGSIPHGTASGTDTYTVTISGVTAYNDGDAFLVRFTNGNTTGCTLNINSLGAITLYRNNDGVLIGGDIVDGAEMLCIYNSTTPSFQVIGTAPNTLLAYVTNADSVTITKGQPVYAFGGQGDRLTVKRANNSSDATSAQTVGLVLSTSIGVNQKGLIMVNGLLDGLSILPTSTWADGDAVYLGATAGSITNVKPAAPNHLVYLGFVTTANNGSAGRMYVRVQNGYELQELHNVSIPTTPTDGQVLTYELSTSLWKAKTVSSTLTVGTTPIASGTIGRILFENGGNVLGQDSALFWDNTNKRLGVGATPATTVRLDVRAQGALTTDIGFRVRNSANTFNILSVNGKGHVWSNGPGFVSSNTSYGENALTANTTGVQNTAFGFNALITNTTGQENTAIGWGSLQLNTGTGNTAIGRAAGQINAGGTYNTYVGYSAGQNGTSPTGNVFVGYGAGTNVNSQYGVYIGYTAAASAAAGNGCIAIGYNSGPGTGGHNLSIGQSAGVGMTTGSFNMHLGYRSVGSGVTTGNYNTLIGSDIVVGNVSNNAVLADMQGNQAIRKDANHNVILGREVALATNATNGFTYIPTCAGIPTGVPTAVTGKAPLVADSTNNKLYIYLGGAWQALN